MQYVYSLDGGEPVIKDLPVYHATTLKKGTLMMLGTTDPDSNADQGLALVSAYSATPANSAIDAVGVLNEETYDSALGSGNYTVPSNVPATATAGALFGKVIVNPLAVYRAEIDLGTSGDIAITSTSSTTLTVPSLQDDIDGYWAYFPLTATGVKGSLRYLTASASGSATMDSALTTAGTNADTVVIIPPALKYSNNLTSDGTKVYSSAANAISGATNMRVLEVWIDRDNGALEPLRKAVHAGLDGLDQCYGGNGPRFYVDLVLKDHAFGAQE